MLRVVRIRARAEARAAAFKASQGSLGGLHRRVITYAGVPQGAVNTVGFRTSSPIIKRQIIRHRFGVELEKVVYYGAYGHKILSERYEDHQLTRLELFEYSNYLNAIDASWLLVRGDYLRHVASPLLSASRSRQTAYFFGPRASGQ